MSLIVTGGCSSNKMLNVEGNWQNKIIHPDKLKSVAESDIYYVPDRKIHYSVKNDELYLYVSFEFSERSDIIKTLFFGATLWINPKGKKKEKAGIRYPLVNQRGDVNRENLRHSKLTGEPDPEKFKAALKRYVDQKEELEIIDKSSNDVSKTYHLTTSEPNAILWLEEQRQNVMYAARIPLAEFGIKTNMENVAIGFKTGTLELPDRARMARGRLGGRARGGFEGRPSSARMEQLKKLQEPTEIWLNYKLASN